MSTKAKSATKQLAIAPKTDPRTAMKLVRSEIAYAVKTRQRVDLMGFNNDDIPRAMIAMQDMIDVERDKKKKASEHIVFQKDVIIGLTQMLNIVVGSSVTKCNTDKEQIDYLQAQLHSQDEKDAEIADLKEKLESSLTTIKTIMEGF